VNPTDLDLKALSLALDDYDPDHEHFLDLASGRVWTFVISDSTAETRERYQEAVAGLATTYRRVPSRTTQEAYEEMEDFVEQLREPKVRDALFAALERKGAFRGFREALLQLPAERQQWSAFRRERSEHRLQTFLRSLPASTPPAAPQRSSGEVS
jgi:hypothetical protein